MFSTFVHTYTRIKLPQFMKLRSDDRKITLVMCAKPKYPKIIIRIENILKDFMEKERFHKKNKDGRINSIYDEKTVIRLLKKHYGESYIFKPISSRHWYDVKISSSHNYWIPCNIKVSKGGTDNALCKKAIVYSLSTLEEDEIPKKMSFNKMIELIQKNKKNMRNCHKEYFYIYVDKKDGSILVRSICDIQNYVSNPQNWLQINWAKEKRVILPSDLENIDEVYNKIRSILGGSLKKLIDSSDKLL